MGRSDRLVNQFQDSLLFLLFGCDGVELGDSFHELLFLLDGVHCFESGRGYLVEELGKKVQEPLLSQQLLHSVMLERYLPEFTLRHLETLTQILTKIHNLQQIIPHK